MPEPAFRIDHKVILDIVTDRSSVLDLGCGNGDLLYLLAKEKGVHGQGIEIDEQAIYECVAKGLNALHGDIDSGLSEYTDKSFDFVILNQSLQQVRHFDSVFDDALRVGKKVIVGIPNFAHFSSRCQLFFKGRAPVTPNLPYNWHESPNLHFLSIYDFRDYCVEKKASIEKVVAVDARSEIRIFPNLFGQTAIYLISR